MNADCRLAVTVRPTRDEDEVAAAQRLRVDVFCGEQGVSEREELDGLDADALHIVAVDESGVIATCRLRFEGGICKLERMAVAWRSRGQGVGTKLATVADEAAASRGATEMLLHSQTQASGFYEGRGYAAEPGTFIEAGIEHVRMRKELRAP